MAYKNNFKTLGEIEKLLSDPTTFDRAVEEITLPIENATSDLLIKGSISSFATLALMSALFCLGLGPLNIVVGLLATVGIFFFLGRAYYAAYGLTGATALARFEKEDRRFSKVKSLMSLYVQIILAVMTFPLIAAILLMWPSSGLGWTLPLSYIYGVWALAITGVLAIVAHYAFRKNGRSTKPKVIGGVIVVGCIIALFGMGPAVVTAFGKSTALNMITEQSEIMDQETAVADTSDATEMRAVDVAASAVDTAVAPASSFSSERCDEWVVRPVRGGTVVVMDQHTPVLFDGPLILSPVSNKVEDTRLYHKMVGSPPLCGEGARYEPNVAEWERRGISSATFIVRDGMSDDEVTAMQVALSEPASSSPITF